MTRYKGQWQDVLRNKQWRDKKQNKQCYKSNRAIDSTLSEKNMRKIHQYMWERIVYSSKWLDTWGEEGLSKANRRNLLATGMDYWKSCRKPVLAVYRKLLTYRHRMDKKWYIGQSWKETINMAGTRQSATGEIYYT